MYRTTDKRSGSIILQVAVLFLAGILAVGTITYFASRFLSYGNVKEQTENNASHIAQEVYAAITEYPAYEWLAAYWYTHADELDIEYDAGFGPDTRTAEKCERLIELDPEIQLRYVTPDQIQKMTDEEQKLYAEITYSWIISRMDQMKESFDVDYLFVVLTDDSCREQFFLLSGARDDETRGTEYAEIYPLGVTSEVNDSQAEAMKDAISGRGYHLAEAGNYVDYYGYLGGTEGYHVLIGETFNMASIMTNIRQQSIRSTMSAVVFQVILSALCMVLISVYVLTPLRKVQRSIRRYSENKDHVEVQNELSAVSPPNEIGQLADDVTGLSVEIDEYMNRLQSVTAEKERISTELALAARIQESMLPSVFPPFGDRSEFDIYASMTPAKEVGGDFYDFYLIDDDHLGIVMADVSGKGVPAALFMMVSKILIKNAAYTGKSPAEVLQSVNEQICSNNSEEMFVTVWLGILTISTGRVTAANAGHEYPMIRHRDGGFEMIRDRHGFVIGGMEGMKYTDYEFTLGKGDTLFLYTDGVAEAVNTENEMFGTDRMLEALNRDPDAEPEGLLAAVKSAVDGFASGAPQFDDLTMLALKIRQ